MDKGSVANVVVEDAEDVVGDALPSRVLQVVGLLHLVLVVLVEHIGVEDQEREGDEVGLVWRQVDAGVAFVVAVCERLHEAVDLLCLLWQLCLHEKLSQRHVHGVAKEAEPAHVTSEHGLREGLGALGEGCCDHAPTEDFQQALEVPGRRIIISAFREADGPSRELERVVLGGVGAGCHGSQRALPR